MSGNTIKFKNFEVDEELVKFTVGSDNFEGPSSLSIVALQEIVDKVPTLQKAQGIKEQIAAISDIFQTLLIPESANRFIERLSDRTKPIPIDVAVNIMEWLIEVYGLRPTKSSEPSSTGAPTDETGTDLPDGAQVMGLTP